MAVWSRKPEKPQGAAWGNGKNMEDRENVEGPWVFMLMSPKKVITINEKGESRALDFAVALGQAAEGALVIDASQVPHKAAREIAEICPQPDPRVPFGVIKKRFEKWEDIPEEVRNALPREVQEAAAKGDVNFATNLDRVHPETWAIFWMEASKEARTGHVHKGMIVWDDPAMRPTMSIGMA